MICLLLALVCFVLATINAIIPRINVMALGFCFWVLSILLK
jgi:hypothetical protein